MDEWQQINNGIANLTPRLDYHFADHCAHVIEIPKEMNNIHDFSAHYAPTS